MHNKSALLYSVPMFCAAWLAGCGPTADGAPDPVDLSATASALQYCEASCDPPTYDGHPISCTVTSCSAFTGYIVCNGVRHSCVGAPCSMAGYTVPTSTYCSPLPVGQTVQAVKKNGNWICDGSSGHYANITCTNGGVMYTQCTLNNGIWWNTVCP